MLFTSQNENKPWFDCIYIHSYLCNLSFVSSTRSCVCLLLYYLHRLTYNTGLRFALTGKSLYSCRAVSLVPVQSFLPVYVYRNALIFRSHGVINIPGRLTLPASPPSPVGVYYLLRFQLLTSSSDQATRDPIPHNIQIRPWTSLSFWRVI